MRKDELYDYTYREFLTLDKDERDLYRAYGLKAKAKNLHESEMLEWQWGRVKQIQDVINKETLSWDDLAEIAAIALNKKEDEIMDLKWFDVARFYTFILQSVTAINDKEKLLAYEPDSKELAAGIEQFQQFSWFGTLYRLAGGDPLKFEEVGRQPWSVIFSTLMLQKTENDFNRALMRQSTHSNNV